VNKPDESSAQTRRVVEKIEHPDYNDNSVRWDFMLLRLDSPVTTLPPVQINNNQDLPVVNEDLTVIGVGTTSEDGNESKTLKEVLVKYVPTSECNKNSAYGGDVHDPSMLCAGMRVIIVSVLCNKVEVWAAFALHMHIFCTIPNQEVRTPTLAKVTREVPFSVQLAVSKCR
jgi:hypothetical protein